MALKILNEKKESPLVPSKAHALKERTFVSMDGSRIATAKDKLRKLLGGAGSLIPLEMAVDLGLVKAEKSAEKGDKEKAADKDKVEDKGAKPAEDKSAKKAEKGDQEKKA